MLKSIRSSYVQLRSIQKGAKKFKKVEVKFSRGRLTVAIMEYNLHMCRHGERGRKGSKKFLL